MLSTGQKSTICQKGETHNEKSILVKLKEKKESPRHQNEKKRHLKGWVGHNRQEMFMRKTNMLFFKKTKKSRSIS